MEKPLSRADGILALAASLQNPYIAQLQAQLQAQLGQLQSMQTQAEKLKENLTKTSSPENKEETSQPQSQSQLQSQQQPSQISQKPSTSQKPSISQQTSRTQTLQQTLQKPQTSQQPQTLQKPSTQISQTSQTPQKVPQKVLQQKSQTPQKPQTPQKSQTQPSESKPIQSSQRLSVVLPPAPSSNERVNSKVSNERSGLDFNLPPVPVLKLSTSDLSSPVGSPKRDSEINYQMTNEIDMDIDMDSLEETKNKFSETTNNSHRNNNNNNNNNNDLLEIEDYDWDDELSRTVNFSSRLRVSSAQLPGLLERQIESAAQRTRENQPRNKHLEDLSRLALQPRTKKKIQLILFRQDLARSQKIECIVCLLRNQCPS